MVLETVLPILSSSKWIFLHRGMVIFQCCVMQLQWVFHGLSTCIFTFFFSLFFSSFSFFLHLFILMVDFYWDCILQMFKWMFTMRAFRRRKFSSDCYEIIIFVTKQQNHLRSKRSFTFASTILCTKPNFHLQLCISLTVEYSPDFSLWTRFRGSSLDFELFTISCWADTETAKCWARSCGRHC